MLCQVAADICFEDQTGLESPEGITVLRPRLKGKQKEGINVLGVVTLHDIERLERESETGRGWIACAFYLWGLSAFDLFSQITLSLGTTDAVFLEKPQYYDLVIDMTSFSPERASRPSLQLSVKELNGRRPSYRLSTIRFTWSDVKLVCDPTPTTLHFLHDMILKRLASIRSGTSSTVSSSSTQTQMAPPAPHPRSGRTPGACTKTCVSPALGSGPGARGATVMAGRRTRPRNRDQQMARCGCAHMARASRVAR